MNLYRVRFTSDTYYVVADDTSSAYDQAIKVLEDHKTHIVNSLRQVEIETLCNVDHLIQDAPDQKNKSPNPPDSP